MNLFCGKTKIAEIGLSVHIGYVDIEYVKVLEAEKIPLSWKYYYFLPEGKRPKDFFMNWITQRTLPNQRANLDRFVQEELRIPHPGYGRMNEYVYILSSLNYFRTPFDSFWIAPENMRALYFGFEDPHMEYVYELSPEGGDFLSGTQEVCVRSECPTYVFREHENNFLCQDISRPKIISPELVSLISKETENWRFRYIITENCGKILTGNSFVDGEVSWLQEYVPFLSADDRVHICEKYIQIFETILPDTNSKAFLDLFQILEKTSKLKRNVAFSECGIAYTDGQANPFLIL